MLKFFKCLLLAQQEYNTAEKNNKQFKNLHDLKYILWFIKAKKKGKKKHENSSTELFVQRHKDIKQF